MSKVQNICMKINSQLIILQFNELLANIQNQLLVTPSENADDSGRAHHVDSWYRYGYKFQ